MYDIISKSGSCLALLFLILLSIASSFSMPQLVDSDPHWSVSPGTPQLVETNPESVQSGFPGSDRVEPGGVSDSWGKTSNFSIQANVTTPNVDVVENVATSHISLIPWVYKQVIDHRRIVVWGLIGVGTLFFLLLAFLLIQLIRIRRRRRTRSKVYDLIKSPADHVEMRPLDDEDDDDDDEEDDMTLFDQPNNRAKDFHNASPIKFRK